MTMPGIPKNLDDRIKQFTSIIHLAFKVASKEAVDTKAVEISEHHNLRFCAVRERQDMVIMNLKRWIKMGTGRRCFKVKPKPRVDVIANRLIIVDLIASHFGDDI
jgi:hypothetical protein